MSKWHAGTNPVILFQAMLHVREALTQRGGVSKVVALHLAVSALDHEGELASRLVRTYFQAEHFVTTDEKRADHRYQRVPD